MSIRPPSEALKSDLLMSVFATRGYTLRTDLNYERNDWPRDRMNHIISITFLASLEYTSQNIYRRSLLSKLKFSLLSPDLTNRSIIVWTSYFISYIHLDSGFPLRGPWNGRRNDGRRPCPKFGPIKTVRTVPNDRRDVSPAKAGVQCMGFKWQGLQPMMS